MGAKASVTGSDAATYQPATGTLLADTRTSTDSWLIFVPEPSNPSRKRSVSGLSPGAGRRCMIRLLSLAVTIIRCFFSTTR
jgi:hypothetical protein